MNSLKPWKRNNDTYENNEKARKAYEALLIVTAREPEYDQFRNFYLNIKEIAKTKFKYDYQLEEVTLFFFCLSLPIAIRRPHRAIFKTLKIRELFNMDDGNCSHARHGSLGDLNLW